MAKLDSETTEIINRLKQESLNIVDEASALELKIFEQFGESEQTLSYMDEMKNVEEEAVALYSRLSTLHLQVARSQPIATPATLKLLDQAIQRTLARIPALERSIQEVKMEWNLL
jgi:Rad3-related DNA helicase